MIVDSMTYDEILDLLKDDTRIVEHKIHENEKKYKRLVATSRNKERKFFKPIRFQSACGFHYVLVFFDQGINIPSKHRLGYFFYVWYIQKRGMYAITISLLEKVKWHATFFTPHFIERYRERCLKDVTISKPDSFHCYLMNNLKISSMKSKIESEKYPGEYWMFCNDGMCLCKQLKGLTVLARTFITWDMAGKDQQRLGIEGRNFMQDRGFELNIPVEDFEEYTIEEE